MAQSMVWFQKTIVSILLLVFPNSIRSANASMLPEKQQASQIIEATGVKGGLVVHLGCGNGKLTAALRASDAYLVQGLEKDPVKVSEARNFIESRGLYGAVSVDHWRGENLPYVDNSVNLIVVGEPLKVPAEEIDRVLRPDGVLYLKRYGKWEKRIKLWPEEIDQWTHCLHGPDNNAVANDVKVGPPRSLQWAGPPAQSRQHENLASISVAVSAAGRVYSIQDETSAASQLFPSRWFLVARDAFNGVILWKRPLGTWESHLRPFRMGPADLARRLVAIDDQVYVTLGYGKPVTVLHGATGNIVTEYKITKSACEILYCKGILYVVTGQFQIAGLENQKRFGQTLKVTQKRIVAVDSRVGRKVWEKSDAETTDIMPNTLAVHDENVYFQNPRKIISLKATNGSLRWKAPYKVAVNRPDWSSPTLVVYENVVLMADRALPETVKSEPSLKHRVGWIDAPKGEMVVYSAADGRRLWSAPCREGFHAPPDVLVVDGLVWTGEVAHADDPGITVGRDPRTGEIRRRRPPDSEFFEVGMPHHRCHRNRASSNYLVLARAGVELIDVTSGEGIPNHWIRGTCQFGVLPCNGLLYIPPHSCACYTQAKLNGFLAMSSVQSYLGKNDQQREEPANKQDNDSGSSVLESVLTIKKNSDRWERGPAYKTIAASKVPSDFPSEGWPTFRYDKARSGSTPAEVTAQLTECWKTQLGGTLTALTADKSKIFVAAKERHCLHALDIATGKEAWRFHAGGRIDSPPTVLGGWLWFASYDGSIYCLRASDGKLAWRFQAAPYDRRIVVFGQLESLWPVPGNVFVRDGVAWAVAGRCSYLDGGLVLWRLDAATGRVLSQTPIDHRDPGTGYQPGKITGTFDIPGLAPDVLSADDTLVYVRQIGFDREGKQQGETYPHLFSPTGLLDDSWWHRSYWIFGTQFSTGYRDWFRAGREVPAGRIMVFDQERIYGFGRLPKYYNWSTPLEYQLFSCARKPKVVPSPKKNPRLPPWGQHQISYKWQTEIPILARAMVLAGSTLFVAGPPQAVNERQAMANWFKAPTHQKLIEQEKLLSGNDGGILLVVSAKDGAIHKRLPLDSQPVFDGMIAAHGRLLLATTKGNVLCLAKEQQ